MNTTFTNCAEKKAKQILNLLQGYTKGIRMTAILILLLMGVSNAWAYTLYLYTGNFTTWEDDSAKFQVHVGNNNYNGTSLGNHWYSFNVGSASGQAYIKRCDANYNKWNEFQANISSTNNVVHVTNWNEGYVLNYYIKHPWDGKNWSWQQMTFIEPNKYTYTDTYNSGKGANINTYENDDNWISDDNITNHEHVNTGVPALYTYTPSSNNLRVDPAYLLTVESDGNGTTTGSQPNGIKMNTNYNISATASEGYVFDKWTVTSGSATFDNSANASTTVKVSGNASATVKATFKPASYTITYKDQGNVAFSGTHASGYPTTHTYGTTTTLKTATKAGYTFDGWFTNSGCTGSAVTSLGATAYTANITLYAKWTATETKHEVTISYKSGDTNLQSDTQEVGEETEESITAPTITGYTFTGWTLGSGIVNKSANTTVNPISITTNSTGSGYTLTANYTKNSYTFTLVQAEGGNATATVNGKAISSPATLEHGTQITLNATAADKYKFSKWVNNGTQVITNNPYTHTLTANTTIQAVFTNTDVLYLKPNNNWKNDYAWFAACFCKTGSTDQYWVKMKNVDPCGGNDYYKVQIPDGGWDYVIFCRMNKDQHELKWDNRWDQSKNQTIPTDGKNCFSVNSGEWGGLMGANGTWSTYAAPHYEPVVFNVTVPAGTPNCYIIGDWDGWSQFTEMTKVDDTHYTVTIPDVCATSAKYKYCYGPSWGCEEVKNTNIPTEAIQDRTYHANDVVAAWISYYIVGYNGNWDTWNNGYKFDINGNLHVNLATVKEHDFKIKSSTQKLYTTENQDGEKHKFNRSHTSERITEKESNWHALKLNVDVAGFYDFTYNPVSGLLTIAFPSKGFRLKITMTDGSDKVYTSNEVNDETETLSFFAPGSEDSELSANITLEYQGSQRAIIPSTSFKTSGVYTAKLNNDKNGITEPTLYNGNYYIRTDGAHGGWNSYETNSDNKMTYFVPREEEKYSYYWVEALPRAARDHTNGVVNVKACVANEYNENLAVMLEADKFTDGYGNVTIKDPSDQKREKINVRFGYNPKTNHFERAMLTGSGNMPNFLNITDPEGFLYKTNNQGTLETPLTTPNSDNKFTDVSNWVYERDVWVDVQSNQDVTVRLTAVAYNEETNSLFGFEDADQEVPTQRTIVGETSTQGPKKMRIIYDFKTNRMIMAWIPGDYDCTGEEALIADVLFMRHENDPVPQLTMTDNDGEDGITPQIQGIQSQFFALELENARDKNAEEHYWISLPFDCVVGSISGVPGYMTVWGIQRYDGAERAQKGWFKETETFWKWLGPDDVMEAGIGYVLSFDKSAATWNTFDVHEEDENGKVINTTQKSLLRLYFPSTTKGFEFKNSQPERKYVNQPCTITRDNRHLQDGNWKIIGPMSYNNVKATPTEYGAGDDVWKPDQDGVHVDVPEGEYKWSAPMFRYQYWEDESGNNWKYKPEDGTTNTYNSFFGYMVQFAGFIQWNSVSVSEPVPAGLTARRNTDTNERTNITMRLEIVNAEGKQQDQTFVALDVEATTTFDPNKDLNKIFNDGETNIYSLSEGIPFAGNALPMEESVVPVGVQIAAEGEYTFRMPDGTEGMMVELVDYETNTRTNLLLSDYIVTLPMGTSENRFALHVQPEKQVETGVENIGENGKVKTENGKPNKYLIDGKLIIRTAEGIFDAQGKRL